MIEVPTKFFPPTDARYDRYDRYDRHDRYKRDDREKPPQRVSSIKQVILPIENHLRRGVL